MLAAVEFDDEALFETNKINDVGANGLLAAKFVSSDLALLETQP